LSGIKKQVRYFYDALNRRMKKEVLMTETPLQNYSRQYAYIGENIFAEFDGGGVKLASYIHSSMAPDDVLSMQVTEAGVTAGLSQVASTFWYLKDHLGTITDIQDSVSGSIVQRYEYSAFGKLLGIRSADGEDITATAPIAQSFGFTGRELDVETGLMFYRARYYDPELGRFLQQDPDPGMRIRPLSIVNKYTYTLNHPTIETDPSGKSPILILALLLGAWQAYQNIIQFQHQTGNTNFWDGLLPGVGGFVGGFVGTYYGGGASTWWKAGLLVGGGSMISDASLQWGINKNIDGDRLAKVGAAGFVSGSIGHVVSKWASRNLEPWIGRPSGPGTVYSDGVRLPEFNGWAESGTFTLDLLLFQPIIPPVQSQPQSTAPGLP
jgi:RHS repeat-associated protein